MSMQSVLLTAALHYILCPSSLPPPLSPPAAGMLSPSPPNPISLLLSFQYNLSLLSPLRFLPSSSPSRFLMQHRHSANMWSSSSPPHPPHPSSPSSPLPVSGVFCLHPSRFCVCSPVCVGWLEYVVLNSPPNLHPSLSSLLSLPRSVSQSLPLHLHLPPLPLFICAFLRVVRLSPLVSPPSFSPS